MSIPVKMIWIGMVRNGKQTLESPVEMCQDFSISVLSTGFRGDSTADRHQRDFLPPAAGRVL
jgi:hypothetical protein